MQSLSQDRSLRYGRSLFGERLLGRPAARLIAIDVARGVAIAGVVLFHVVWDLAYTGLTAPDLASHPAWVAFARTLAGSFMVLVGVSLVLAHQDAVHWARFAKRLLVIVLAALAISIVTRIAFPERFIYFGILHAIAVGSVVGILFLRLPAAIVAAAGAIIFILPDYFSSTVFDIRPLAWIGFSVQPPPSNDFVPVFPWVGLTLLGLAAAKIAIANSVDQWLARHQPGGMMATTFTWMGCHSLAIYLIHQPVLLGILVPLAAWLR